MNRPKLKLHIFGSQAARARAIKIATVVISILTALELLYLVAVFSNITFVKKWRTLYIETAMSTMSHQWLATSFIPEYIIDEVMAARDAAVEQQADLSSNWGGSTSNDESAFNEQQGGSNDDSQGTEKQTFYELYWELDEQLMEDYLEENPDVLENGYMGIDINEAGLDEDGIDVYTSMGEQVLAIDAPNNILLLRITGDDYKGVLAVVKDSSQVSVGNAAYIGSNGQYCHQIAEQEGAILAMNASGYSDTGGVGNGGAIFGKSISHGVLFQGGAVESHYKRIELRTDNKMYIEKTYSEISDDVRDAVEFTPALIVDGEQIVSDSAGWGIQPRSVIGQSDRLEMLMLVIDGRQAGYSLGTTVGECAAILMKHGAAQACNLDGGSSAIMIYKGNPITRCSNGYEYGRTMPNAFIAVPADDSEAED